MLQRLGPAFSQFQPKRTAGDSPFLAEKKVFYDTVGSSQTPIPRDAAVDVADAGKPPTAAAVKREKQAQVRPIIACYHPTLNMQTIGICLPCCRSQIS